MVTRIGLSILVSLALAAGGSLALNAEPGDVAFEAVEQARTTIEVGVEAFHSAIEAFSIDLAGESAVEVGGGMQAAGSTQNSGEITGEADASAGVNAELGADANLELGSKQEQSFLAGAFHWLKASLQAEGQTDGGLVLFDK